MARTRTKARAKATAKPKRPSVRKSTGKPSGTSTTGKARPKRARAAPPKRETSASAALLKACFEDHDYAKAEQDAYVATFTATTRLSALRVLGYATMALGQLDRAVRAYRALVDEYGLMPDDPLAVVRRDLEQAPFDTAPQLLALLAPPKVDRSAAEAFWKSLDGDLEAVLRDSMKGDKAPPPGRSLSGKWIETAWMLQAVRVSRQVNSLAPLAAMPNLESLSIAEGLRELPFHEIGRLARLQRIDIEDCGLSHVSFLRGLVELEKAVLFENRNLTDASGLADSNKLTFLQLGDGPLRDVGFLRGKRKLAWLFLTIADDVHDLSALGDLVALTTFEIRANRLRSLDALAAATQLERVEVRPQLRGAGDLRTLAGLGGKPGLRVVKIEGMPELVDISALADATKLEDLAITDASKLADFSALARLPDLEKLNLFGAHGLTDLGVLGPKPRLTSLEITNSGVVDLSPLAACEQLTSLSYYQTTAREKLHGLGKLVTVAELRVNRGDFVPEDVKQLARSRHSAKRR